MSLANLRQEGFRFELEDGVATLTLDRPDRINALTFSSYQAMRDAFRAIHEAREVRCVVLRGDGPRGFCSGGDVRDIIGELFARDMRGLLEFTRLTGALVQTIHHCRVPVVAALHGVVCGAGAVIALASDVRLAAPMRASRSCSRRSGSAGPTWAPPGCSPGSSVTVARASSC